MDFSADKELKRIEKKIASMKERGSVPQPLVELIEKTLRTQLDARVQAPEPEMSPPPDPEDATRHLQGAPLLERSEFPIDAEHGKNIFLKLLDLLASVGSEHAEAVDTIRRAIADDTLDIKEAISSFLNGDDSLFLAWAEKTPNVPRALSFLTISCATPLIENIAAPLAAKRDQETVWAFGHCPVCGSPPLIARLLEKEGFRHMNCSFCHTEYRVKRLQCPYCCEEDASKLKYFDAKEEPGFQVHVCDSCNMYIKAIDFRNLERPSHPLLDDMDSMAMDVLAQQEGYMRPTLSAWGF